MNRPFFFLILFSFLQPVSAQKVTLRMIPAKSENKIAIPFSDIEVIDARYDRSHIGGFFYLQPEQIAVAKMEVAFPDSLNDYLPKILERLVKLDDGSNDKLVVLIKQFRFADQFGKKPPRGPFVILNASILFYKNSGDSLYRLSSFEGLLNADLRTVSKSKEPDVARIDGLAFILQKIIANRNWEKTGVGVSFREIDKAMQQRFNLPVFNSELKAGCYAGFSEFINNNPSIVNLQPVYEKKKLVGFKDQSGKKIDPASCWGGSDGTSSFISFRNAYCLLIPSDHSFKFKYESSREEMIAEPIYIGLKGAQYHVVTTLFHLNMDDGTVFSDDLSSAKK
jgi:hypothetical protein